MTKTHRARIPCGGEHLTECGQRLEQLREPVVSHRIPADAFATRPDACGECVRIGF